MCIITNEKKDQIWEKGQEVEGFDPKIVRKDACGAWIAYDNYGNRDSIFGWEIDHIYPKSLLVKRGVLEEEIENIDNLRPLNWINNDSKGMDYPSYTSNVDSEGTKNIRCEKFFDVNTDVQAKIAALYGKYLK